MKIYWKFVFILILSQLTCFSKVKVHDLFSDKMVIQRDAPIKIFGTGDKDGESVTVEFAGQKAETVVQDGKWQVILNAMHEGGPFTLSVTGTNQITLKEILLGDVWVCGGQSNMQTGLRMYIRNYPELYEGVPDDKATPDIRIYTVGIIPKKDESSEIKSWKKWQVLDQETAIKFSATGYFFAKALQPEIKVPIGLICSAVGGTKAEAWTPLETLQSNIAYKGILDDFQKALENYPVAMKEYKLKLAEWKEKKKQGLSKKELGRQPRKPLGHNHTAAPANLFNGMIAPLVNFPVKGVLWYQGEANANSKYFESAITYRSLFKDLITSWRTKWGQPDMPFLFVQLASYGNYHEEVRDGVWPWVREAQAMALELPNTAMALAIDAGAQKDIHPPYKRIVGERLQACALKVAYGKDIVHCGPTYENMEIQDDKAILSFSYIGGGLVAKELSLDTTGEIKTQAGVLEGFTICGEDKVFVNAKAEIQGDRVIVSAEGVSKPVAVRYAWAYFPKANLYNKEGFPTVPFRTDNFEPL